MSKRTHHNSFWELEDLETVAVPSVLVDMLRSGFKSTALALYLYLVRQTKQKNHGTIRVHTKDLLFALDITSKTLNAARKQLEEFNLVISIETTKQGVWEYEVLNPSTGGSLPSRDNVDFTKLSNDVAFEFYKRQMPDRWDAAKGKFWCPFGDHAKARFQVTFDRGTDRHAMWSCQGCTGIANSRQGDSGGLVQFYRRKHGVTHQEAMRRTRAILQTLIQEDQQAQRKATTEPAVYADNENSLMALA